MKVLIADDEVVSRRLIESSVRRWGYTAIVAENGLEAAQILRQPDAPKLAILDWLMPGLDGLQLCRELRSHGEDAYTYTLLLTCKQDKDDVVRGLEAGADDYIIKPFNPRELRVRLNTGKRILCLLEQLTTARETLRDLAARDPLTGLWNHTSIVKLLGMEIDRAQRQGSHVGVILIDLDHFKSINDNYGHLVGDHVLREAAHVMDHSIRPYDAVGRLGGEEFLIVLPGCDEVNSVGHAERLRAALNAIAVQTRSGPIHFSASFGIVVVGPDACVDAPMAIGAADTAMYAAKHAGRDRVELGAICLESRLIPSSEHSDIGERTSRSEVLHRPALS
jgi:two-component system cell cycle response regulator